MSLQNIPRKKVIHSKDKKTFTLVNNQKLGVKVVQSTQTTKLGNVVAIFMVKTSKPRASTVRKSTYDPKKDPYTYWLPAQKSTNKVIVCTHLLGIKKKPYLFSKKVESKP